MAVLYVCSALEQPSLALEEEHAFSLPNDDGEEITLMYAKHEKVPMKDFGSEVRASLDIAHFLQSAVLMLDVVDTTLDGITDLLLTKVLEQDEPMCSITEAKSILFTTDTVPSGEKDLLAPVHLLARTIQCTCSTESGSFDYDQSWICAIGNLPSLQRRHVAIARLKAPANMGRTSKQVRLFVLVLCPSKEKGTKNALETGRTFATIFSDMDLRQSLLAATTEEEFKRLIIKHSSDLTLDQQATNDKKAILRHDPEAEYQRKKKCRFAGGLRDDLRRRLPHYLSDYRDGLVGDKTIQKVISTTLFLYFASILPAIAFGVLNDHNTQGKIDVKKVIIGQVIGGIFWGVFSGQPLLVQLTTAPLAIYIKIIYYICVDFDLDFKAMYCAVGLWNSLFLIMYSLFDVSRLMRWSTRSTEEIFALFISIAFCNDAFNDVIKNFKINYYSDACKAEAIARRALEYSDATGTGVAIAAATTTMASTLVNNASYVYTNATQFMATASDGVANYMLNSLTNLTVSAGDVTLQISNASRTLGTIAGTFHSVTEGLVDAAATMAHNVTQSITQVTLTIGHLTVALTNATETVTNMTGPLASVTRSITQMAVNLVTNGTETIGGMLANGTEAIGNIGGSVASHMISNGREAIGHVAHKMIANGTEALGNAASYVAQNATDSIGNLASSVTATIGTAAAYVASNMTDTIGNAAAYVADNATLALANATTAAVAGLTPAVALGAAADNYSYYNVLSSANSTMQAALGGVTESLNSTLLANMTTAAAGGAMDECKRENSVLYLLLMFGTLWLSLMLYNFNKTPYLNANKRELLADYALPVAVIVLSFLGSYVFRDIKLKSQMQHFRYDDTYRVFVPAKLYSLTAPAWAATLGLGFCLSMLFFMDQNIGSAMVNNPCNKLKKGPAYHLDMLVVGIMNGFLSIFGLPWMHACLPHSPLHVRSLADVEERVDQGHVYEIIVKVRETRLTGLFSNILIGLSMFLLPYPLAYIPTAVLDGLFLYMAVTALNGNQMFERITLLFMEQAAYPPNHYIRRVPQRNIHKFTGLQVVQLLVMCSFGFAPYAYMKMMFPVLLLLLLPIRHKIVPRFIEAKYLAALDGQHQ